MYDTNYAFMAFKTNVINIGIFFSEFSVPTNWNWLF